MARQGARGTFVAACEDVGPGDNDQVRLRPGYTRYSAVLRTD